jgi:hypothetical protein
LLFKLQPLQYTIHIMDPGALFERTCRTIFDPKYLTLITEIGFCHFHDKINIVGSFVQTDASKTLHGISPDTWVCHAYYTHEGKKLDFPIPVFKTFSEMMAAVEVILKSL